jgi:hypothetical protein
MTDRPSVKDFFAFRTLRGMVDQKDITAEAVKYWNRQDKRKLEKIVGPLHLRTDDEIIEQLASLGEHCESDDLAPVYFGVPKERWPKAKRWLHGANLGWNQGEQPTLGDRLSKVGVEHSMDELMVQLGRWFSGKRYGIVIEEQVAQALMEAEVDMSGLDIRLPWSPMLVKGPYAEFLMWNNREGKPRVEMFRWDEEKQEPNCTLGKWFVGHDKESLAAWLATVTKGEDAGDTFELKVGPTLVAVLPKINARYLITKHKITDESEHDKGSWIRKGHFRMTKDGFTWVEGAHFRKELPFVLKQHNLERKGQPQELFRKQ